MLLESGSSANTYLTKKEEIEVVPVVVENGSKIIETVVSSSLLFSNEEKKILHSDQILYTTSSEVLFATKNINANVKKGKSKGFTPSPQKSKKEKKVVI